MITTTGSHRWLLRLTLALLVLRLLTLGSYPLLDSTEARYAEIGRKILELGDWVTPWYDYGVPFWGKPPLSMWLTALSFNAFGINEFAARLPHFLAGLIVLLLLWSWARDYGRTVAIYSIALLAGALLFIGTAGGVMTDMTLAIGVVLVMRGFWLGLHGATAARRRESWLVFIGLALGLLAKGPLILVLTGLPAGLWFLFSRVTFRQLWQSFPWLTGTLLMLLLAAPWYVLAEQRTPGFLNYFLIGEHWHRFVTPGWQGDLYGRAHVATRGSIWLLAVAACLPWAILLPTFAWRQHKIATVAPIDRTLVHYLLLWGLAPCVFFTLAANILPTYVLPGLPALALLGGLWLARMPAAARADRWLTAGILCTALAVAVAPIVINRPAIADQNSARALVRDYLTQRHANEPLLFITHRQIYSPAFYAQGRVTTLETPASLPAHLGAGSSFVAMYPAAIAALPATVRQRLQPVGRLHGQFQLYAVAPTH